MIKRIIFDIDETLLTTYSDCMKIYKDFIEEKKYNIMPEQLYNAMGSYEKLNQSYNPSIVTEYLKKELLPSITVEDYEEMLKLYGRYGTLIENDSKSVLEYLSEKYEIVALSNWYVTPRKERLKQAGILKYFKEVYGFENCFLKPDKESFEVAKGIYQYDECLIVGDNPENDIIVPSSLGMHTVLIYPNNDKYFSINKIGDLTSIL